MLGLGPVFPEASFEPKIGEKLLDDTMKAALPEDKLKATWQTLLGQVGAFKKVDHTKAAQQAGSVKTLFGRAKDWFLGNF